MSGATLHELAFRTNSDIDVTLSWDEETDECFVFVTDRRGRLQLVLPAGRDEALRVFRHPFPYAAARGVPYDENAIGFAPLSAA